MKNNYDTLALVYDRFQSAWDATSWADFYAQTFFGLQTEEAKAFPAVKPKAVDLGCGTGVFTLALAERGFSVCGVDLSCEMLARAEQALEKKEELRDTVVFKNTDIIQEEFPADVDFFCSTLDTLNHLKNEQVKALFTNIARNRTRNAVFLFDLLSLTYMETNMGQEFYYDIQEDYTVLWENNFKRTTGINTADVTLFVKEGELFRRDDCIVREYYHSPDAVLDWLHERGYQAKILQTGPSAEDGSGVEERHFILAQYIVQL